jgi:hypothetical protein
MSRDGITAGFGSGGSFVESNTGAASIELLNPQSPVVIHIA